MHCESMRLNAYQVWDKFGLANILVWGIKIPEKLFLLPPEPQFLVSAWSKITW